MTTSRSDSGRQARTTKRDQRMSMQPILMTSEASNHFVCTHEPYSQEASPTTACATCAGYELFRQAIVEHVDSAWTLIYQTYSPLVFSWVLNHPCFWQTGEEAAYFVNRAFEKMWSALTPEKFDRAAGLPSLLKYLQICVHSVIIDAVRKANHHRRATSNSDDEFAAEDALQAVERILEEMWQAEMWERIRRRLSPREEQALFYRFFCGLKPRQICAWFPQEFATVDEIYITLQNVLNRLRRDQELKHYWAAWNAR